MNPITGLLAALSALTAVFVAGWSRMLPSSKERPGFPNLLQIGVGAFTNFFDTLGIGSYATSTTLFRFFQLVDDRIIPGTLNVGHALPTVVQTFIYTSIIPVDVITLFAMIGASVLGAWLGAGVVARWPRRTVQIGMGMALLVGDCGCYLHRTVHAQHFPPRWGPQTRRRGSASPIVTASPNLPRFPQWPCANREGLSN